MVPPDPEAGFSLGPPMSGLLHFLALEGPQKPARNASGVFARPRERLSLTIPDRSMPEAFVPANAPVLPISTKLDKQFRVPAFPIFRVLDCIKC